jgi:hypothetical protein
MLVLPLAAEARPYTVVSCDSAAGFGHNAAAWARYGNAGVIYESCPTNGGPNSGISNRLTGGTYAGFSHSGHAFTAPPGATITQIRWSGRMARDSCKWGAFIRAAPSGAAVMGMPNGQFCEALGFDNRGWPMPYGVPAGTTQLEQLVICGAGQCAPGAVMHSHVVEVTVDDPVPPSISLSGPLASGQWVSGAAGRRPFVDIAATDNAGVQRIDTLLGGESQGQGYGCNWSSARPCPERATTSAAPGVADLSDGRHVLSVAASDAAGNPTSVTRDIYVDNTPPDPVLPEIAGGTAWRRMNGFAVSWMNPRNVGAPIIKAHWKLCAAGGTCSTPGERAVEGIHELPRLLAPYPGEFRLYVWLEDAAGNQREANAAVSVPLRFDPEPPEVAFLAPDPADPLRVVVNAIDRHSGVASGEIEMRAVGAQTWHGLRTERQGSQLVSYVDDERFRRGAYEFRAHVTDQAGNEASSGKRTDGAAATLQLPARIDTRLVVGLLRPARGAPWRFDTNVATSYRRTLRLTGRLTNSDGQPIEGATVEALDTNANGSLLPVGLATTGPTGAFRYVVRATRNRDLLFRYAGSRRIGSASSAFRLRVRAASSIRAGRNRVRNGQAVGFSGQVRSRPLPTAGKLLEMQAHFRGRWRTFSTLRTNRSGAWNFTYRFGATLGRVLYRFRVSLPAEGGYPFIDGHSRVAKVLVFGP